MSRWIRIQVGIFDHEIFEGQPFSERDAWIWIISKAAWKDTTHRVGFSVHDVKRGSFFTTVRQLQNEWKWKSTRKVHVFLKMLESETMIETTSETGKTLISVCNYSKYHPEGNEDETEFETSFETILKQERNTKDTIIPLSSNLLRSLDDNKPEKKSSKTKEGLEAFRAILSQHMSEGLLNDFITHRRSKKASNTETSANMFLKAANDAGLTPTQAAEIAIERNWITVKREWLNNSGRNNSKPEMMTIAGAAARAAEEMRRNEQFNTMEPRQGNAIGRCESGGPNVRPALPKFPV